MYRMKLKASLIAMSYLSNEERVRQLVQAIADPPYMYSAISGAAGDKVSVVNFKPIPYKNVKDYIFQMNSYVADAASKHSAMVVFPELSAMTLISAIGGYKAFLARLASIDKEDIDSQIEAFLSICEITQGFISEIFLNTFSELAKKYGIIICAGGLFQTDHKKIFNRQFVFAQDGTVAGIQDKLFLSEKEMQLGVTPGELLTPAVTSIGNIAILDANTLKHYQPFFIANNLGCNYIIAGVSPFSNGTTDLARFRSEEYGVSILAPGLAMGKGFGVNLQVPAGIYAPRYSTRDKSGIAAQSSEEATLTARIDLSKASSYFDVYSADRNPDFFAKIIADCQTKQPKGELNADR